MVFKIKPKIERFIPHQLRKGWGVVDLKTGEIKKSEQKNRIERYSHRAWAKKRCDELNKPED